jgi:repressor LexA
VNGNRPELAGNQERLLGAIGAYIRSRGYPPSIRDLQDACAISSTSVVHYNLQALQRKGYIIVDLQRARAIRLVGDGYCPACGRSYGEDDGCLPL